VPPRGEREKERDARLPRAFGFKAVSRGAIINKTPHADIGWSPPSARGKVLAPFRRLFRESSSILDSAVKMKVVRVVALLIRFLATARRFIDSSLSG